MRRTACLLFFALGCPAPLPNTTGFAVDPVQLAGTDSSGEPPAAESSSSSTDPDGTSTGAPDSTGVASTSEPQPDFGPVAPQGCAGKIDFLFVISGLEFIFEEDKILEAIPGFYSAIDGAFADFDTHIMVVDSGGTYWGTQSCDVCTDDCDPNGEPPLCGADIDVCDQTIGAGIVFPIGEGASNRRCDLAGGHRYIVTQDEPDPLAAFDCIARIGEQQDGWAGEAMWKAISPELNAPGGCNEGFVRDDALLVVTIIAGYDLYSDGHIYTWTNKLLEAKHGDPDAFVVLVISGDADIPDGVCSGPIAAKNRLRTFAEYVPNGMFASLCEKSFVPFFTDAVTSVLELCDSFIPQ